MTSHVPTNKPLGLTAHEEAFLSFVGRLCRGHRTDYLSSDQGGNNRISLLGMEQVPFCQTLLLASLGVRVCALPARSTVDEGPARTAVCLLPLCGLGGGDSLCCIGICDSFFVWSLGKARWLDPNRTFV